MAERFGTSKTTMTTGSPEADEDRQWKGNRSLRSFEARTAQNHSSGLLCRTTRSAGASPECSSGSYASGKPAPPSATDVGANR
jgi:hypothetical protein